MENFDYFNFVDVLRKCESAQAVEVCNFCIIVLEISEFDDDRPDAAISIRLDLINNPSNLIDVIADAIAQHTTTVDKLIINEQIWKCLLGFDASGQESSVIFQLIQQFIMVLLDCSVLVEVIAYEEYIIMNVIIYMCVESRNHR